MPTWLLKRSWGGIMATGFAVKISDLRGWARQVGRASGDLDSARRYAAGNIADADFGRILETITGDYAAMLSPFHTILQAVIMSAPRSTRARTCAKRSTAARATTSPSWPGA
jgi:hypothetical protein